MTKEKIFYEDFLKNLFVFGFAPGQNPAFETKMSFSEAKNPKNHTQKKRFLMENLFFNGIFFS